jgi:hypothetical protein
VSYRRDPQLLIRETARGWICLGAVHARELLTILWERGIPEVLVMDLREEMVIGALGAADLKYLVTWTPAGETSLRSEDLEWMVRGMIQDPRAAPDPRFASAILVIDGVAVPNGRAHVPRRDATRRTGTGAVPLRRME